MFHRLKTSSKLLSTFTALLLALLPAAVQAEVVGLTITRQSSMEDTEYQHLEGQLHFQIDPQQAGNAVIADIDLAPQSSEGRVEFSADFQLWRPKNPDHSNSAAWLEIPNRGGKSRPSSWMMQQGFTLVNIGWEFDVPADSGRMRIQVPTAQNRDGSPIRGVVSSTLIVDKPTAEYTLTNLADYQPVDLAGPDSKLILRTQDAYPAGTEIPRSQWSIQNNRLRLEGGFQPGKTYEIFYLAEGPPIAGLGYAAIRDTAAWLKYASDSPAHVKYVYGFGSSQCGRLLRDFLYLGFNTDEHDRPVFDGVVSHVAGAGRLVLNQRWSTPRAVAGYYTSSYPFADSALVDPVSGHREGILDNPRVKHIPKVFYINMAAEYWGSGRVAALTHTNPAGTQDVPLPDSVRSYFFAGTSHGPAPFPPGRLVPSAPLANPVNTTASQIALRQAMHEWVTENREPPPSVYPQFSQQTLVPVAEVNFPAVPGMSPPNAVTAGGRVRNPQWPDGAGTGAELPLLVPQVDQDGNDLGGIRMPAIAVPLGTATGWVFRPQELGSPQEFYLLRGAWIPFAKTKADREATRDPRLSLEERYTSKEEYLSLVEACLNDLIQQRLLLESDLQPQLQQASQHWDWVMKTN